MKHNKLHRCKNVKEIFTPLYVLLNFLNIDL